MSDLSDSNTTLSAGPETIVRIASIYYVVFIIALLSGCAKQAAPPGGIEDKTGPGIISNYPAAGAVNVDPNLVVELEFSELVNRPSVESALFMSPDPIMRLKYKWSGRKLRLLYLDPLEFERTYVVSVGSEAKDLRGNPAGVTTTIAFSTGDQLDRGMFHGWVDGVEKPQSLSIWAYLMKDESNPDPFTDVPDYKIQAKSDGTFRLDYLKLGMYRIFAVADKNRDGLWNPVSEMIGTAPWDVAVTENTDPWISIMPMMQDTSEVFIYRCKQIDSRRVEIRLSQIVDSCRCSFSDSTGDSIHVLDSYINEDDRVSWILFAESEMHPGAWIVSCAGYDLLGREWSGMDTLAVVDKPDSTSPKLMSGWPSDKSSCAISPDSIRLEFDEPIRLLDEPDSALGLFTLKDTIEVSAAADQARSLIFRPATSMDAGGRYRLMFDGRSVTDLSGNSLSDTTIVYPFTVLSPDSLGAITGSLASSIGGKYLLILREAKSRNSIDSLAASPGPFRFDSIPAGDYLITIIQDMNRDARFSSGKIIPFEFSEPFSLWPDTISVRARWENETELIWLPNP
jgi:hypothetical protein